MRPWIVYSLLRFGIFAVMMAVLATYLRLPLESNGIVGFPVYLIAAVGASIFSLVVSYIFFPKLRAAVAADFAERRARTLRGEVDDDTAEEDALLDGDDADPAGPPPPPAARP